MSTKLPTITVTAEEELEVLQINDVKLTVLPSDIVSFQNNAVFEESYLRSKAVFAFRSKYSSNKVIITLPISVNPTVSNNDGDARSQYDGLKVLTQLTNYPYCFIRSPRIRSYVSARARISSTGFMMFAVDEINIVQDQRSPDVMFAEFHLLYCDFSSLTDDFMFRGDMVNENSFSGINEPENSEYFREALDFGFDEKYRTIFNAAADLVNQEDGNSTYINGKNTPFNMIQLLAPTIISRNEVNGGDFDEEHAKKVIEEYDYKEVKVTAKNGNNSFTPEFMEGTNNQKPAEELGTAANIEDATVSMLIYWTSFHDLSFGGVSAVKNIKFSLKNKLAQQFVGSHKYPFIQYMGRYPARVSISLDYNTGSFYTDMLSHGFDPEQASVVSTLGQLNNVLDYNNEMYPEVSAYNVIKIKSIVSAVIGLESLVPNQTYISASADPDSQGIEEVNISFIEADVDDFMKMSTPFPGRPSWTDSESSLEAQAVLALFKAYNDPAVREEINNSPNKSLFGDITEDMSEAVKAGAGEFYGNVEPTKIYKALAEISKYEEDAKAIEDKAVSKKAQDEIKEFVSDQQLKEIKDFATGASTYKWPNGFWSSFDAKNNNIITNFLERRSRVIGGIKEAGESGRKLTLEETTYSSNQRSANYIDSAYSKMLQLVNAGDDITANIINNLKTNGKYTEKALIDYSNSYVGANLDDLGLPELADPIVSPFYFLLFKPYFSSNTLRNINNSVEKEVTAGLEEVITKNLESTEGEHTSHFGLFNSQSGVMVNEMRVVDRERPEDEYWKTSEYGYIGSSYGAGVDRGGAWEGVPGGNPKHKAYDNFILEAANLHGVPPGLVKAVIHTESDFKPNARSPVGAQGLMQIMPDTAKWLKITGNVYDPRTNIFGGTDYLGRLMRMFNNDFNKVIAAYNSGQGTVQKYGDVPPFRETKDYVKRVTKRWKELYNDDSLQTVNSGQGDSRLTSANNNKSVLNARQLQQAQVEQRYNDGTLSLDKLEAAKVVSVKDGDSIIVKPVMANGKYDPNEIEIRIKHLDTPETSKDQTIPSGENKPIGGVRFKGNVGGEAASNFVKSLVKTDSIIYIDKSREIDPHKRETTNVYLDGGKELLAEKVIVSGHGAPWTFEQGGGGPVLNKLKSLSGSYDSKTITDYKKRVDQISKLLNKAKSVEEIQDTLRNNKDMLAKDTFTYNGKLYKINAEVAGAQDKKNPKPANITPDGSISIANVKYPVTNFNIHLRGLQNNSSANQQYIESGFGARKNTIHEGLDITSHGTSPTVVAAASGTASTFYTGGGGKTIVINHHNGFVTRYMHLASFGVKHNTKVTAGQGIGTVGNTNTNTGTHNNNGMPKHLHMETWVFKNYNLNSAHMAVNPWETTALNLLDKHSGKEVWQNIRKFIKQDQSVTGVNSAVNSRVYNRGGPGKVGILTGRPTNETLVSVQGQSIQDMVQNGDPAFNTTNTYDTGPLEGVDLTSATISQVDNLPPSSSVYYEKGTLDLHFDNMAYHSQLALNVAFPVIKVYVVVGSEVEEPYMDGALRLNHYFEIKGVQDVRVNCNNDDTPVDTLLMSIANPSFIRTDNASVAGIHVTRDFSNIGTEAEVSFISERIRLFPGARLHVRMGYSNNPNKLRTVFNGVITELGNESSITLSVLAEGYGRELLLEQLYPGQPEFARSIDTPQLISRAMSEVKTINNFGNKINMLRHFNITKDSDDLADPETKRLTTNYANVWKFYEAGNHRQRMYMNIYAAEVERLHSNYNTSFKNYLNLINPFSDRSMINEQFGFGYAFNGQTPWDVLKEMEYRHPGTKVKPLFYQDRMTMFFGLKEQMYIARDLDPQYMKSLGQSKDNRLHQDYLLKRPIRFDLVTGFHMASSETNILLNNMKINNKYNTCANIVYFDNTSNMANDDLEKSDVFEMKLDDTLSAFDERYGTLRMRGLHGKYSAFVYGTTFLRKEVEKMYGGTITLIGNPCIKAGDFIYLNDNLRRFEGLIKVRECRHYMNAQTGFTTEITPGVYVEPRNFIYSALMLKLAFTAKIALANASFSINIASNDEVDFKTYQDFLEKLQFYAKRKESFADSLGWSWVPSMVNDMVYDTGVAPVVGMAMGLGSVYSIASLLAGQDRVNSALAKGMGKSISIKDEIKAMGTAFGAIKGIWTKSNTSSDLLKYSRDTLKAARTGKNAFNFLKAGLGVTGAASWFAASRTLSTLATVASAALLTNPLGWLIRAAVSVAFAYIGAKVQEAGLTRQPLLIMPIANNGRPFMAGMSGYRYDSYLEAKKENWRRNMQTISKASYLLSMTSQDTVAKVMSTWVKESYVKDRVDAVVKGMVAANERQSDLLERTEESLNN